MAKQSVYSNNSQQKDFIRSKWIEFAQEAYGESNHDFGILTFPAQEMQDLWLFKNKGLIDWEEVETESADGSLNYRITKGKIRCFEKNSSIQRALSQRLIAAKVDGDFIPYVAANYSKIISGKDKTFPVDVVNLDFDGRLHPNPKYPLEDTIKYIFEFQKTRQKKFSFFITWPLTEGEDLTEFKDLIHDVIESNLVDPSAAAFTKDFQNKIGAINKLHYERKSIIGVSKIILKKASQNLYLVDKCEHYVYGGVSEGKKRMISVLFNFSFDGKTGKENIIYSKDVLHSMADVIDVNDLELD